MTDDRILERIQKLIAQAEGTNHEAEAQTFFDKAEELMLKYAIDEATLEAARVRNGGVAILPIKDTFVYSANEANKPGKVRLIGDIARAHDVKVVYMRSGAKYAGQKREQKVIMFGFPSDLDFTKLLYTSLVLQGESAASRAYKTTGGDGYTSRYVWMRSFFDAFTTTTGRRIVEARRRATETVRATGTGAELVLVDRSKAVSALLNETFPRLGTMRATAVRQTNGALAAGHAAGERADISGGRGHLKQRTAIR